MSRSNRPIRQMIEQPRLSDLTNGDPLGLADHLEVFEAMKKSRSEAPSATPVAKRESKPIGKKHYRKAPIKVVRGATYRRTNRIDHTTGRVIWERIS